MHCINDVGYFIAVIGLAFKYIQFKEALLLGENMIDEVHV